MNILDAKRKLLPLSGYMGDSGGGGGGSSSSPNQTQTQTTELPEWARPYAKDVLAKGSAITDINQNPYQTYGANRIAGFSPLQQQSFQGAANMQPSQQLGTASDLASAASMGALGTNYQAGRYGGGMFGQGAADFYMNPYQQNVTDITKREAARQSGIAGTQQQSQATQAGAFGGGRDAIMRAERERNLGQQMNDIQAQGSNAAYTNAQQQFNADQARRLQAQQLSEQSRQYGAGLGLQGLQTALQGAGQLGQLGGQEYGQQMGINQLQNQYGAQMQQQAQRPLDMAYQDFLNQQNYPYKQLGFMSDLVRGLPLGQKSTSSVYDQGPGTVQTLAGLGGAAYGFGKSGLFGAKEGGLMSSYADGGQIEDTESVDRYATGGVTSPQNVESILTKLSDQQLQQAKEAALNRRDVTEAQMIDAEMAERASIRGGLGGAFNQIPEAQQEEMMAGGGMVAFAPGGVTYKKRSENSLTSLSDMMNKQPEPATPQEYEQGVAARQPMLERIYGEDITKPYLEETKSKREKLPEQMEKDVGLALAAKSLGLLARRGKPGESQRTQLLAGLGEAGQEFAGEVGRIRKDNREADEKLRQYETTLAAAQQARKEGMANKAMSLEDKAEAQKQEAFKIKIGVQEKVAQIQSGLAQTEMQGENALKVAGVSAAAHRYAADKPGEMERMMSKVNAIRTGKDSHNGKTGEEGAKEYINDMQATGAARYGAKYTGPDKSFEHSAEVQKLLKDNPEAKGIGLELLRPNLTPEKREELSNRLRVIGDNIAADIEKRRQSGGAAPAAPAPTGAPSGQSPLYVTTPDGQTFKFKTQAEADKFRQKIGG